MRSPKQQMDSSFGAIAAVVPDDHHRGRRKSSDRDSDEVMVVHSTSSTILPSPPPKFKRPSILKHSGAGSRSPMGSSAAYHHSNGCLNRSLENCNGLVSPHLRRNNRRARSVCKLQSGSSFDRPNSSRTPSPPMRETRSMSAADIFAAERNVVEDEKGSGGSHDDARSTQSVSEKNKTALTSAKSDGKKMKRPRHSSGSSSEIAESNSTLQKSEQNRNKNSSKKRPQKRQKLKIEVEPDSEDEKLMKRFIKKPKPTVSAEEFQVPVVKRITSKAHGNSKSADVTKFRVENPIGFSKMIKRFEDSHANRAEVPKHGFIKPTAWICALCLSRANEHNLGDLLGPYFISASSVKSTAPILSNLTDEDQAAHEKFVNRICRSKARQKSAHSLESDAEAPAKSPTKAKLGLSFYDIWLHGPCMLWTQGLQLQGRKLHGLTECLTEAWTQKCAVCKKPGASVGCVGTNCSKIFHYHCSVENGDCQLDDEAFHLRCPAHRV